MAIVEKEREFTFTVDDFNILRKLSNDYSGIQAPDERFDMFYSRLSKRVRKLGLPNFKAYCTYLQSHHDDEFTQFINAITTNLTSFFREQHHFDYLRDIVVPELLMRNKNTKQIRVWSAGCSTGEEPYSIAMTLLDVIPSDWDITILATDLDTNVLQMASEGIYTHDRVAELPPETLKRWFMRNKSSPNHVKVKMPLQEVVEFKQLNLMNDWAMKIPFDVIFCRNVLIYFDRETKTALAKRYAKMLSSKSWLFIGHSESLNQICSEFKLVSTTCYQKNI